MFEIGQRGDGVEQSMKHNGDGNNHENNCPKKTVVRVLETSMPTKFNL